jgi:hypothetical protein
MAEDGKLGRRHLVGIGGSTAALAAALGVASTRTAQAATVDGIRLDSYTGTDDQRLTQAIAAQKASNPRQPILLAARNHTFTQTRATYSGMRILGPNQGWQNPEIGGTSGALPQCNVTLNCGSAGASWLVGTSTTYDVEVSGICFRSGNGATQFYHHPFSAGTAYATHLDSLTFHGFKHVLGMPGAAFAMTLASLSGVWTCVGVRGTQFSLRGSDNFLWVDGKINYGWVGANGGQYLVRFENCSKSVAANMYLTARGGSRCILVEGNAQFGQGGLVIRDSVLEGQNAGDPAMGALVVVKGGGVTFRDLCLNFGMYRPTDFKDQVDSALVMVSGSTSRVLVDGVYTLRANTVPESVPVVRVTGGVVCVSHVFGMGGTGNPWVGLPRVRRSAGTLINDATTTLVTG